MKQFYDTNPISQFKHECLYNFKFDNDYNFNFKCRVCA